MANSLQNNEKGTRRQGPTQVLARLLVRDPQPLFTVNGKSRSVVAFEETAILKAHSSPPVHITHVDVTVAKDSKCLNRNLTVKEVVLRYALKPYEVYRLCDQGHLECFKDEKGRVYITEASVQSYMRYR